MHCEFPITVSVKSSQKTSYSLHLHLLTEEQKSCEVSALLRRCQTSFSSKKKWKCICPICPIYNNTYFKVVHCSISPNLQQQKTFYCPYISCQDVVWWSRRRCHAFNISFVQWQSWKISRSRRIRDEFVSNWNGGDMPQNCQHVPRCLQTGRLSPRHSSGQSWS